MGDVGIADNPRNYYRIYFGVRKRKWWWYIFFWDFFPYSRMPTQYTYTFITCTVLQGDIDYLIMV